ncbi:C-type mannose receptor 2-like isoform X1 [Lampetra fluviatilis]
MAPLLRVLLLAHLVSQAAPQTEPITFLLENKAGGQCLTVQSGALKLAPCDPKVTGQHWLWGSTENLMSASQTPEDRGLCLTATALKKSAAVSVERCSASQESQQQWQCRDSELMAAKKQVLSLTIQSGQLSLGRTGGISWRIHGSEETPCSVKHQPVSTLFGTGHGQPCHLPYRYKGTWYVGCTTVESRTGLPWCATTPDYDQDELWGYCPTAQPAEDGGCPQLWKLEAGSRACVQVNEGTRLTWHEARTSCALQGAELLSVEGKCEAVYFAGAMLGKDSLFWMGLNRLNSVGAWQWSDGRALTRVHWESERPTSDDEASCGVLNPESHGLWKVVRCTEKLPYICYQRLPEAATNATAPSLPPPVLANATCPRGWSAHGAACFRAQPTALVTWHEARAACVRDGAELARVSSEDEHDFVSTRLAPEDDSLLWIGLSASGPGAAFAWSDGSPVTLTVWDRSQPSRGDRSPATCVYLSEHSRRWSDAPCDLPKGYVCRRPSISDGVRPADNPDCQPGWVMGPHSCYWVGAEKAESFTGAFNACRRHNATLVSITSSFEQGFVHSMLGDAAVGAAAEPGAHAWLGLRDARSPGAFRWESGEALGYTHWERAQPGGDTGCVTMDPVGGRWSVRNCSAFSARFVCEKKLQGDTEEVGHFSPTPTTTDTTPLRCADGWYSKDDLPFCYQVNRMGQDVRQVWRVALEHCRVQGAELLSVQSTEEHSFVDDLVENSNSKRSISDIMHYYDYSEESDSLSDPEAFWVGANQLDPDEGNMWSDGSAVDRQFVRFHPSESEGHCGTVENSYVTLWRMEACDLFRSWICKVAKGKPLNPMSNDMFHKENMTADGWYALGTRDIFYSRNETATFAAARRECARGGGDLAMPRSEREQRELLRITSKYDLQEIWMGLQMDKGVFGWVDGSPLNYTNWSPFEPNNHALEEYCGSMSSQIGNWNDRNCGARLAYICQRGNGTTPMATPAPTAPSTGGCPRKWLLFGSKCYLIRASNSSEYVNWDSANLVCHSRGGHLVTVQSPLEQAFLLSNMVPNTNGHLYIGLTDRNKMDEYLWTENLPLSFSNWAAGQPSRTYSHDCVGMDPFTGKWVTISCFELSGFICQKFRDPLFLPPAATPAPRQRNFGGLSYWVVAGERVAWARAAEVCAAESAGLPHVMDPTHHAFLTVLASRLREPIWLGLHAHGNKTLEARSRFAWASGERLWYEEWAPAEPRPGRDCAVISLNGSWASEECDATRRVVCQSLSAGRTPEHGTCPEDPSGTSWVAFRGHCYSIHTDSPKSWSLAVRHCMGLNSSMVSIHDMEENKFLVKMSVMSDSLSQGLWTGLFKLETGEGRSSHDRSGAHVPTNLYWQDESPVSFTNWNWGEPNSAMERCVELLVGGRWNDKPCSMVLPYVCKKPQVSVWAAQVSGGAVSPAGIAAIVLCMLLVVAVLCTLAVRASHTRGLWALPCVPYSGVMFAASRDSTTDSGPKMLINDDECNEQL